MRIMTVGLVSVFTLSLALTVDAQARGGKKGDLKLGARVESWRSEMEFTGSTLTPAIPFDPELGVTLFTQHSGGFVTGDYSYHGMRGTVIHGYFALGFESIVSRLDSDATVPGGPRIDDTRFDDSLVFEVGAGFTHRLTDMDLGGSVLFRSGSSEADRPPPEEITYAYTKITLSAEVGLPQPSGVRPFAGIRYSMYQAEWELEDPGGIGVLYEAEFEQPLGAFAGVEISSGRITSRFQLSFLDTETVGFVASLGIDF